MVWVVGFEPTKHCVRGLKSLAFDRLATPTLDDLT
jgi:hypothetical protein